MFNGHANVGHGHDIASGVGRASNLSCCVIVGFGSCLLAISYLISSAVCRDMRRYDKALPEEGKGDTPTEMYCLIM